MPFDLGFNYRATSSFVTDQNFAVPVLTESFPNTYTNGNGFSINAGWDAFFSQVENSASGNDPRIAGDNYATAGGTRTFKIDLGSGSAPGAGTYAIDLAMGNAAFGYTASFTLKDNAAALITGSGNTLAAGHFEDATGTDVTASTTWTGTPVSKTFTSTTANMMLNAVSFVAVAHLRLTLQPASAGSHLFMLMGVGA